jgi:hypothetical protein
VEPLDFGDKHFEVRLGDQPEDAIRAFRAFGQKPLDEIRRLLSTLISSAKGDEPIVEAKLAQVGYRII